MLKKLLAFFEAVFVVFLVILIITIFTFFISFSKDNSLPTVFGHSFFILDTDDMQNENGKGINKGSLVIASDAELDSLKEGMVVLCDVNDIEGAEPDYDVLRIYGIEPGSETTKYTVSNEKMASNRTYIIDKDKIVAKCKYSSELLGQVIAFSRTSQGILTLVIIPCVVLIALQIVHIVGRARRNKFEQVELETFEFPSDMTFPDDEQSPLYDPTKSDYSQKTDVEEFFNKDYKSASKRRKKSVAEDIDDSNTKKASEKSFQSADSDLKNADKGSLKKSKKAEKEANDANAVSVAIKEEKAQPVSEKTKQDENTPSEEVKTEEVSKAAENSVDTKATPAAKKAVAEADEQNTDAVDNVTVVQAKVQPLQSQEPAEATSEESESAKACEPVAEKVAEEHTAEAPVKASVEEPKSAEKPEGERPKKKTTVKKRAVVKKGPSASAADLLKAIDTESKKLK